MTWDTNTVDRLKSYETGIEKVCIFKDSENQDAGYFTRSFPWSGVTSLNQNNSGAEFSRYFADDIEYAKLMSKEEEGFSIEAYASPEEFDECDGTIDGEYTEDNVSISKFKIKGQNRKRFGICYFVPRGRDGVAPGELVKPLLKVSDDTDLGKVPCGTIHVVYGCYANAPSIDNATINDSPELQSISWDCTVDGVDNSLLPKYEQVTSGYFSKFSEISHLEIDNEWLTKDEYDLLCDKIYAESVVEPNQRRMLLRSNSEPKCTIFSRSGLAHVTINGSEHVFDVERFVEFGYNGNEDGNEGEIARYYNSADDARGTPGINQRFLFFAIDKTPSDSHYNEGALFFMSETGGYIIRYLSESDEYGFSVNDNDFIWDADSTKEILARNDTAYDYSKADFPDLSHQRQGTGTKLWRNSLKIVISQDFHDRPYWLTAYLSTVDTVRYVSTYDFLDNLFNKSTIDRHLVRFSCFDSEGEHFPIPTSEHVDGFAYLVRNGSNYKLFDLPTTRTNNPIFGNELTGGTDVDLRKCSLRTDSAGCTAGENDIYFKLIINVLKQDGPSSVNLSAVLDKYPGEVDENPSYDKLTQYLYESGRHLIFAPFSGSNIPTTDVEEITEEGRDVDAFLPNLDPIGTGLLGGANIGYVDELEHDDRRTLLINNSIYGPSDVFIRGAWYNNRSSGYEYLNKTFSVFANEKEIGYNLSFPTPADFSRM